MKTPFEELTTAKDEAKEHLIRSLPIPQFYTHDQLFYYLKNKYKDQYSLIIFLCLGGIIRSRELYEDFKVFKQDKAITNIDTYGTGYMPFEKFANSFENFHIKQAKKIIVISNDSVFNEVHSFLLMLFSKLRRLGFTNFDKDRIASGDLSELGIDLIIMWEEDGVSYSEDWEI